MNVSVKAGQYQEYREGFTVLSDTQRNFRLSPQPTPAPSGPAIEGNISKCEGTQLVTGGSTFEVEIEGTVRALRRVSFVSIEGTANGSFVGRDSLGTIEAGSTKSFSIRGFLSLSGSTLRCSVEVTYRTSGSGVVSSVSFH